MEQTNTESEYIIGIDLGTTNCCVSIWRNGNLEIIPDSYGRRTIPSYIAFTKYSRYIGIEAKNQKDLNTKNVFYEIKRLIGRKYDDIIIKKDKQFISYDLEPDESNNILVVSDLSDPNDISGNPNSKNKKKFTPEELQSMLLKKLCQMATEYLSVPITKAVITCPAYFNDGQRQATKDAATIAGLECVRIINEPTAAGLAYGLLDRTTGSDKETTILVYDFGGGTLDVSILSINNGLFWSSSSIDFFKSICLKALLIKLNLLIYFFSKLNLTNN